MSGLGGFSMWDLFQGEVESQMQVLSACLLNLEAGSDPSVSLAAAMRAAHSIKGAARIVQADAAVSLAHAMEDCLVAAQEGAIRLDASGVDVLLASGDLLSQLGAVQESAATAWMNERAGTVDDLLQRLAAVRSGHAAADAPVPAPLSTPVPAVQELPTRLASPGSPEGDAAVAEVVGAGAPGQGPATPAAVARPQADITGAQERSLRVGAQALTRLMGLAGEALVQGRWFAGFSDALLLLKRRQGELLGRIEVLERHLVGASEEVRALLTEIRASADDARLGVAARHADLEQFALNSSGLSDRLYREVVATRMRPFGSGVEHLPRAVRDLARQLGKQVLVEVQGRNTEVDREILDRLEAPLNHMVRNSIDHGIETPEERLAAGKPATGAICLEARHRAGLFVLTVSDDGRGVDSARLRTKVVERGLATPEMAAAFSETELLEFLFLPGFSTASAVTDMSGRGVGMDAVQEMARSVGGRVRLTSKPGEGLHIHLELPLTLSVVRTFVAQIGGQPVAFPLTRIARALVASPEQFEVLEGQHYITVDGERIGVIPAHDLLGFSGQPAWTTGVPIVLLGERAARYGLAVDRFVGEFDMVVRPLDPRLGKVRDVSAVALMDDGSPVLILDIEDLARSMEAALKAGGLRALQPGQAAKARRRRILVVDDSITVRELERALLENAGYEVEVAVDGMDGWNALRAGQYDLTVSDIDMPRMTGIELVTRIRADARLNGMPVIIVSYKDREEDRLRGLEAGADRYMTKSSFHDQSLLNAAMELIGPPE